MPSARTAPGTLGLTTPAQAVLYPGILRFFRALASKTHVADILHTSMSNEEIDRFSIP